MLIQVTITPSEGKRLIGRAVASMDIVQDALKNGTIVIATSTTSSYVLEELLGKKIEDKGLFTIGVITGRGCCITDPKVRYLHHVIRKGKIEKRNTMQLRETLTEMGPKDVFIKGANAVDPFGQAGIFLGSSDGGTIGNSWGYISANGITSIFIAGLEKLVPVSLSEAAGYTGIRSVDKSLGMAVGLMVVQGNIVTEIEALNMLTGVQAIPIGGGGIDGGEGTKTLVLEGDEDAVEAAYELVCSIKGEPALKTETQECDKCNIKCEYRSMQ
jgi:hypothetical protein